MAPLAEAHGTIVANIVAAIRPRLKPPCRVVVEAGITPAEPLAAICAGAAF